MHANIDVLTAQRKSIQKSYFIEYKDEGFFYYGLFVSEIMGAENKSEHRAATADGFQTALSVFDCPFTKKTLQTETKTPIYLSDASAGESPNETDKCVLLLRFTQRNARPMADIMQGSQALLQSSRAGQPGLILSNSHLMENDTDRVAFFYKAYLTALRILFPDAYESLIESDFQLSQVDFAEPLIHALHLLSETAYLKKNNGMGHFFVAHSLAALIRRGISEDIKRINSHAEYESFVAKLQENSAKCVILPTIFSKKEIEWAECKAPLYISCVHIDTITNGQAERTTIAALTPSPFLSWHALYAESLKHIDIGLFHAYSEFIEKDDGLKLSPSLNALGCLTLFVKKFYGRKIIAMTNVDRREITCNLLYLVERGLAEKIMRLENLQNKSTAMTFFSFTAKSKKESIKQCALLAIVTFFPEMFKAVQELDWYTKSSPIVAGGVVVSIPNHSIATEVYHTVSKQEEEGDPLLQTSTPTMVRMLGDLFQEETVGLPESLRGSKISVSIERIRMNLSTFYVVRVLARRSHDALNADAAPESTDSNLSLDFLEEEESAVVGPSRSTSTQESQTQLAQVFSRRKSAGVLQACCLVAQIYFPSRLCEFVRFVLVNQEKCQIEERNAQRSHDAATRKSDTANVEEELRQAVAAKEPLIASTLDSVRESLHDRESLSAIIHNLFLVNKRRPSLPRGRDAAGGERTDTSCNLSLLRSCVQKAARLNLRPLVESVTEVPQDSQLATKATRVALQSIGEKTVIASTTSQYPLKSMLTLYKFLATESEFCRKHMRVDFIRGLIANKPFANVPLVQHSLSVNALCVAGLGSLVRALMRSQYGYDLRVTIESDLINKRPSWSAKCFVSLEPSFLENGTEAMAQQSTNAPKREAETPAGVYDFSAADIRTESSPALIASVRSNVSRKNCLKRLYASALVQLFPDVYPEIILKSEADGLSAALEVMHDLQSEQSVHMTPVLQCTEALPIAVDAPCHLTHLRVAFALSAYFTPVEEVVREGKVFRASLYKTDGDRRALLVSTESPSQIYSIFKAYETLSAAMGISQIDRIRHALSENADTADDRSLEPLVKADEKPSGNISPVREVYHRMNENYGYCPGSRQLPEALLKYGLKLQYGIELMVGTNKTDEAWTTMLYGVIQHRSRVSAESEPESASLWDREWSQEPQAAEIATKRIFLAGCSCSTKANSLKMACIHVLKTALPDFYALTPRLVSWDTPPDFIELIETDEESL